MSPNLQSNPANNRGSLSRIDSPPDAHEGLHLSKIYHPLSLPVLALLIPASIFGVLARLGLQALVTYDGRCIFPLAYIQSIGCLIMGFCMELKQPLGHFYAPLYTALTTGFCGSLTTFSSWQLDIFNSWVNGGQYGRSGLRDFIDGSGKTVFTLALSLASVSLGSRLAALTIPHVPTIPPPNRTIRYSLTTFAICCWAAAFPAYFRLPASFRHQVTASLLFAYPGTLTRYLLSIWLNPMIEAIPLGTFIANGLGTALLGTFHVLQSMPNPPSPRACAILQGLEDGYCGCLTTISTFAVEVRSLGMWKGFRYALMSWAAGQLLLLVILGPSFWVGHVEEQVTCV